VELEVISLIIEVSTYNMKSWQNGEEYQRMRQNQREYQTITDVQLSKSMNLWIFW